MQTPNNPQYAYAPSGGTPNMPQMAQELQSQGRNGDSIMVHMNPQEVGGLQALARANGTSLTINPMTGMPEAFNLGGFLKKMLPTLIGAGLAATGVGAPLAAGMVGLGSTALTGSLKKGLMAGLGAYGGASLAGAAGLGGSISNNAFGALGSKAGVFGANMGAGAALGANALPTIAPSVTNMASTIPGVDTAALSGIANNAIGQAGLSVVAPTASAALPSIAPSVANMGSISSLPVANSASLAQNAASLAAPGAVNVTQLPTTGFFDKFASTSRAGLPGMLSKYAPYAAAAGLATPFMSSGKMKDSSGAIDNSYQGPYYFEERKPTFAATTEELLNSSKQRNYFDVDQPGIYNTQGQLVQPGSQTPAGTPIIQSFLNPNAKKNEPMYSFREVPYQTMPQGRPPGMTEDEYRRMLMGQGMFGMPTGMAKGGAVPLDDGAFVVDARTVSELGNGSSNAGIERLSRLGGRPVRGPGDGVSDSVPARIGRNQPARIARDEVIFSRAAVKRLGKGSQKKGAQKLYAMMKKAHKARKKAGRGSDTKLAAGLGVLA